jgi:hypothetical protein
MAALLPNVGKVSVLGSRAVPSIISAADPAEETVFSATAAEAETAAAGVKNLAPKIAAGGAAAAAGVVAVEKGFGSLAKVVAEDAVAGGGKAATEVVGAGSSGLASVERNAGRDALEGLTTKPPAESAGGLADERLPLPRSTIPLVPPVNIERAVTKAAVEQAGLRIYAASDSAAVDYSSRFLIERASDDITANVVNRITISNLQSDEVLAAAFRNSFERVRPFYSNLHCDLDSATGVARISFKLPQGVVTAEFNAYKAIRTAAIALQAPPLLDPNGDSSSKASGA